MNTFNIDTIQNQLKPGIREIMVKPEDSINYTRIPNKNISDSYQICNNILDKFKGYINDNNKLIYMSEIIANQVFDVSMLISIEFINNLEPHFIENNLLVNKISDIIMKSKFYSPNKLIELTSIKNNDINNHFISTLPELLNSLYEEIIKNIDRYTMQSYLEYKNKLQSLMPLVEYLCASYFYSIIRYMNNSLEV